MGLYHDDERRQSLAGRITGASVSMVFHAVLIACLVIWMVPKDTIEKEEVVVDMVLEDVVEIDDVEVQELLEEEVEDEFEDFAEVDTPEIDSEVEERIEVDVETMPEEIVVESLFIDPGIEVAANVPDREIKNVMVKKYGSRAAQNGLLGTYFTRFDFFGKPYTRIDKTLNKPLNSDSPWPGKIPPVCYSVLWTGRLVPKEGGIYTIYLSSDDGARLWIDDEVVVEQWYVHATRVDKVQIKMIAGQSYEIKYAFNQHHGPSCSKLEWSCEGAGIKRQLIPTDCMWADGVYSLQVLNWIKQRNKNLEKHCRRNPAIRDEIPMSHIVRNYGNVVDEKYLRQVKLDDVIPLWTKFKQKGLLDKKPERRISNKKLKEKKAQVAIFGEEVDVF